MSISVVVPIYNECDNILPLYRQLNQVLQRIERQYEILFIDDGSTDNSRQQLQQLAEVDPHVKVVFFRRNYGQTAAMQAGLRLAIGDAIVTLDGDLQNDPADIPTLVRHLDDGGFDIVCGWRRDRKDPWLTRQLPSRAANRIISWATGVHLNDYGCSLKVFRAEVVKPLRLYGELHRFLPALASDMGVRIAELPVNHRPRVYGRSKYGLSRTIRVLLDLVTVKFLLSYSTRPLQVFGLVGGAMGVTGAVTLGYLGTVRMLGWQQLTPRTPLVLLGILLVFTGVQLVTLGLLAELQARTYHESQGKPVYVIRQILQARRPEDGD